MTINNYSPNFVNPMAEVATETEEVKTEKVFDLTKMEHVEVPVKKEEPAKEEETPAEEEKPTEETKPEVETTTTEEETTSTEEKSTEEVKPAAETKTTEEDDAINVDDYIKETFSEKYGVKSEDELTGVLEDYEKVAAENEELKKKLAVAEKAEPVFESENEKKIFKFLKAAPADLADERLVTHMRLNKIDVDKEDGKVLMQEAFIIDNPDLPREDAILKFNRDFNRKYTIKKEDFTGTEEEYKEELRALEIDKRTDIGKAKKFITAKQAEFKTEKPSTEDKATKENPEVKASIEKINSKFDAAMKDFKGLVFEPTDKKEDRFTVSLNKEQHAEVLKAVKNWVSNPVSYNKDGKLLNRSTDPHEIYKMAAFGLYPDEISEKLYNHAIQQRNIIRAEEIAKVKPTSAAKGAGDVSIKGMSEEKQQEMLLKKKKEQSAKKSMVYK